MGSAVAFARNGPPNQIFPSASSRSPRISSMDSMPVESRTSPSGIPTRRVPPRSGCGARTRGMQHQRIDIPQWGGRPADAQGLLESDRHSSAKVTSQPQRGAPGKQEITVDWRHGAGDRIGYQIEAFTRPLDAARNAPSPTRHLTGFVPSQYGFHFANAFPSVPDITISIPFGKVEFGDASEGLCGGMVYYLSHAAPFLAGDAGVRTT